MWCSITQQLSGASRGHKAKLVHGLQKTLEWSLPEVSCKTEESAHFKVSLAHGQVGMTGLINHLCVVIEAIFAVKPLPCTACIFLYYEYVQQMIVTMDG